MGRPERHLHADDPVTAFAQYLRALRRVSGLTYEEMAVRAGYARSTLCKVASGRSLSHWHAVQAYVSACDGDIDAARRRYEAVQLELVTGTPNSDREPASSDLGISVDLAVQDADASSPRPDSVNQRRKSKRVAIRDDSRETSPSKRLNPSTAATMAELASLRPPEAGERYVR